MKKNNIFAFNWGYYIIRFGIIELILILICALFAPIFIIPIFFLVIAHLGKCYSQVVSLDPFQITHRYKIVDRTDSSIIDESIEKYYYINKIKTYKINYLFITIYGDIDYRKRKTNGLYEEKNIKIKKVLVHRTFRNEQEFIQEVNNRL